MSVSSNDTLTNAGVADAARAMAVAARTAPKTRGVDLIEIAFVDGPDLKKLSETMLSIHKSSGREAFLRNSPQVEASAGVLVIGSKLLRHQLVPCGICGFRDCAENEARGGRCAYNMIDLGIAAGSAASAAKDSCVDNRIMWTIGMAAIKTGVFTKEVELALGMPLSATGKNIFFDRK